MKRKTSILFTILALVSGGLVTGSATAAETRYTVRSLPIPVPVAEVDRHFINDKGQVAGTNGASGFLYLPVAAYGEPAGLNPRTIPTRHGVPLAFYGLNNQGMIFGHQYWNKNNVVTEDFNFTPTRINHGDQLIGLIQGPDTALRLATGQFFRAREFLEILPDFALSPQPQDNRATIYDLADLNDSGFILGARYDFQARSNNSGKDLISFRAILIPVSPEGAVQDLPLIQGNTTYTSLNDSNEATAYTLTNLNKGVGDAQLYLPAPNYGLPAGLNTIYSISEFFDPPPPAMVSNSGVVVAGHNDPGGVPSLANFFWQDGQTFQIQERLSPDSVTVTVEKIHDMSDAGLVLATGSIEDGPRSLLVFDPVEPELTVNVTTDGEDPDPQDDNFDSDPDLEGIQVSLRAAIQAVNADKGDAIKFGIPGQGTPLIKLTKALPVVEKPSTIDGTTQTGGFVEIDGNGINAAGLNLQAGKTEVRGLIFNGFIGSNGTGIRIAGDGENVVAGNYFGVDASGNIPKRLSRGILIDRSSANLVGGTAAADQNIIWATDIGLRIQGDGSHGNRIVGNRVGLGKNGESLINSAGTRFASGIGLQIAQGDRNLIGGLGALGNAIAGDVAILVGSREDHPISDTRIVGNRIGLTSAGSTVAGGEYGVVLATLNPSDTRPIVSRTQILNNRIAGNRWVDVWALGKGVVGTTISGNTIGLRFDGAGGLPNAPAEARTYGGVRLDGAPSTTIRGNTVAGQKWNVMVAGQPMLDGSPWDVSFDFLDPDSGRPGDEDLGNSGNSLIESNTIGIDAGGVVPAGAEQSAGIALFGYPRTITVKDNTVAGPDVCLWLDEGDGHSVVGTRLGTPDGQDRGSKTGILVVDALKLTVGPGNVIGRCAEAGIMVDGQAADIRVLRNKIGTDPAGLVAWPNIVGLHLKDAELSETEPLLVEGNLISGNTTFGVLLDYFAAATEEPVQIADNRIGVDEAGKALPNDVGVRVNKGNARLTGDTIAYNVTGGLAVIDPASVVSVTGSPFFANGPGPGLGPLGIVYGTDPFNPPMQLAALKSAPDASGKVSMVFALPNLGGPAAPGEKVTIEFYANDGLVESQGRYPLFVREIDPTKAWSERFVVSPSSLMATKATFTVTLTRQGKTSEFSSRTVREGFVWPELLIGPSNPGEILLAWPSGGKPGLFVVEESSLLDGGASFVLRQVTPKVVNGVAVVTIPVAEGDRYFRLVMDPEALFR